MLEPGQSLLTCSCSGGVTSLSPCRCCLSLEAIGCDERCSFPSDLYSVPLSPAWPSLSGVMAYNPSPSTMASDNVLFVFGRQDLLRPMGTSRETDGEGRVEGLGQMDRRLAGAAGTEPGPLRGFSHVRNRDKVGPQSHHAADHRLGNS